MESKLDVQRLLILMTKLLYGETRLI
jgi:hypothetical protein